MTSDILTESRSQTNVVTAKLAIIAAVISIVALVSLHFLSPEFEPSWRMVSEYANGQFEWVLFIFFTCWGISSWCLAYVLWSYVSTKAAKAGVALLFVSGLGEVLAAFFDVNHPQHGTSGTLGVPTFVVASLLISYHLKNRPEWNNSKRKLLWSAHATWISLVLVVVTMIVMIAGFKNAGIAIGPDQKPPTSVPDGVVAVVGYANRILIATYIYWLLFVANKYINIFKSGS